MPNIAGALQLYSIAIDYMHEAGLESEIVWQKNVCPDTFSETTLLRETAWVVLCSGFRETVIRNIFDYISLCYYDWESATAIAKTGSTCALAASAAFKHMGKLNALVKIAEHIADVGFLAVKKDILLNHEVVLQKFPFIGPITVRHLAKNLGFNIAKPDRHLVRIANKFGFNDVDILCSIIAREANESVKVVDLILWRYIANNYGTINKFYL